MVVCHPPVGGGRQGGEQSHAGVPQPELYPVLSLLAEVILHAYDLVPFFHVPCCCFVVVLSNKITDLGEDYYKRLKKKHRAKPAIPYEVCSGNIREHEKRDVPPVMMTNKKIQKRKMEIRAHDTVIYE